jgi:hypothetical protein
MKNLLVLVLEAQRFRSNEAGIYMCRAGVPSLACVADMLVGVGGVRYVVLVKCRGIRQVWMVDRVAGLPATAPSVSPGPR